MLRCVCVIFYNTRRTMVPAVQCSRISLEGTNSQLPFEGVNGVWCEWGARGGGEKGVL